MAQERDSSLLGSRWFLRWRLHPLVMRLLNEFGDRDDILATEPAAYRGFLLRYRSSSSPSLRFKILAAEKFRQRP